MVVAGEKKNNLALFDLRNNILYDYYMDLAKHSPVFADKGCNHKGTFW